VQSDTATVYNFSRALTQIMTFPEKPRKAPRSRSKRKTYNPSPCHTFGSHGERRGLLIMSIITILAGAIAIQPFGY
jgi:hypothetical protein